MLTNARLCQIHITPSMVFEVLSKLDCSKAIGPDNISNKILYEGRFSLSEPLSKLFNISLTSGVFPDGWKLANVISLFKKEDKQILINYQPVSLLSCLSRGLRVHSIQSVFLILYRKSAFEQI
mgnify:CR=1 FL=1